MFQCSPPCSKVEQLTREPIFYTQTREMVRVEQNVALHAIHVYAMQLTYFGVNMVPSAKQFHNVGSLCY